MSVLDEIQWGPVKQHYKVRVEIHKRLLRLQAQQKVRQFALLALGISDSAGNFSADEHKLGPRILRENLNAEERVFDLASEFITLARARDVPPLIRDVGLRFLQIGVGSELSCMVNPIVCWVANTRTIWTHLFVKHGYDFHKADTELRLYRNSDETSEMAYPKWAAIHGGLIADLTTIANAGEKIARPGPVIKYIWADAVASAVYAHFYE
jgi:hypothetical protein